MTIEALGPMSPMSALAERGGGKAAKLAALGELGYRVPRWFCIPAEAFDTALREVARLSGPDILAGIESLPVPLAAAELVRLALREHGLVDSFVAVRSSGLAEDGTEQSFAGQFESFLYRCGDEAVLEAVGRCWASAFSERNTAYRRAHGMEAVVPRMGVVVQRMIDSDSAGVAFSRNPLRPLDRDSIVIESVWGQCEGLVSGALEADGFTVNRQSLEFEARVVEKSSMIVRNPSGDGTQIVPIADGRSELPSLDPDQVVEVARTVLELETRLGSPQDCEWAYVDGQLHLLQTRPITTLPPDPLFDGSVVGSEPVIWDNSNIIESYSGVTSPLTFSHVSRAYREVYYQTCHVMGVPDAVMREHEWVFRNMLGLVRGRIYYNLLNWYRLLTLFPLLGRSGGLMETMMGVKQSLQADLAPLFDKLLADAPRYGLVRQAALLARLVTRLAGGARANVAFLDRVDRVCAPLEASDLGVLSLQEQVAVYRKLEEDVLEHWTAPIVNDTRCMIAFGFLKSLTERWIGVDGSDEAVSLQNDLLCGEGDLKSTEPMRLLLEIAREVEGDLELREQFLDETPEAVWEALEHGVGPDVFERFRDYIDRFGFRCVDELKLEATDYHDRPHLVVSSVQGYLRNGVPTAEEIEQRKASIRGAAEELVRQTLKGPRRWIYSAVLEWARRAVRDRELLRFERTRTFGIIRGLFRGVGENLVRLGVLEVRDHVFYLTVEEILGFVDGRPGTLELREVAAVRRAEFEGYQQTPAPPDRFLTNGAAGASFAYPALLQDRDLLADADGDGDSDVLRGTSCCPGVVEAPVWVARTYEETDGLNGEILVTERTDPGWIPVFPACSGLIIERGSLLSHSAVVARELGIPTIVGVRGGPLSRLETGQRVRMDAGRGEVKIL